MRAAAAMLTENEMKLLTIGDIDEKQRSVPTETWALLGFIGYLIVGLLFYCYSASQLSALDSIYLAVVTFSTVGYGDIHVQNRIFGAFYVLLGAGIIAALFSIFSNSVMEQQEAVMQQRFVDLANSMTKVAADTADRMKKYQRRKLQEYFDEIEQMDASEVTAFTRAKQQMYKYMLEQVLDGNNDKMQDMNLQVYEEELRQLRSKGLVDFLFVVIAVLSGSLCMTRIEGWSFDEAFYWACVTVTTTGYGDVTPTTTWGKMFTIAYIIIACALAAKGFGDMVRYPLVMRAKKNELRIAQQFGSELSEKTLRRVLQNDFFERIPKLRIDEKQLVKSEFVLLMLEIMGKIQDKDIMLACQIFDRLDVAADGVLDEADQKEQIKRARARDVEKAAEQSRKEAEQEALRQSTMTSAMFANNLSEFGSHIGNMLGNALHTTTEVTKRRFSVSSSTDNTTHQNRRTSQRLADQENYEYSSVHHHEGDDSSPFKRQSLHSLTTKTRKSQASVPTSPSLSRTSSPPQSKSKKSLQIPSPVDVDFDDVEAATVDIAYSASSDSPLRQPTTNPMIIQQHQQRQQQQLQRQFAPHVPAASTTGKRGQLRRAAGDTMSMSSQHSMASRDAAALWNSTHNDDAENDGGI